MDYELAYHELLDKHKATLAGYEKQEVEHSMFFQISNHATRAIVVINVNKEVFWINSKAEALFGYPLHEAKGIPLTSFMYGPQTDLGMSYRIVENALRGISTTYEHIAYRRNGSPFWVSAQISPLYDQNSQIDKVSIYVLDVSLEKEFLKTSIGVEQNLLFKYATDIVYKVDCQGNILDVNNAWTTILGYSKAETLGRNGNDFVYHADLEKARASRQSVVENKALFFNIDIRIVAKNGQIVWLNATSVPLYSENKEILGYLGISKNISEQKRTQQIQELLTTNTRSMISLQDRETRYLYVSPSFQDLTGWLPEELIGKKSLDYYHPDDIEGKLIYREHIQKGEILDDGSYELRYRKKDGSYIWIEINAKWCYDDYLENMCTVITAQIVDHRKQEMKRIEAALEEERKLRLLKTNFMRFIAHEFKTPLSIIKAVCDVISVGTRSTKMDKKQLKSDLDIINKEVNGLVELIDDVLVFEQLEGDAIKLRFQSLDILSMIRVVIQIFSFRTGNMVNLIEKGNPQLVWGDKRYIELILRNLLSNAIKYSANMPLPIISVHFLQRECTISIKDFGIGISEEDMARLYEPFFRCKNVGQIEGTGLGLSIVKKLVEAHNGKIACISKINEGTEMILTLPLAKEEEES